MTESIGRQAGRQAGRQRQSGIELLRILSATGVIVLHYNNPMIGGALNIGTGVNRGLLYFLEALNICAVNVFVLINGFFDVEHQKRDLMKPLKLIVQVMLFNLAFYLQRVIAGRTSISVKSIIRVLIPANWFIIIYCGLYVISPFINIVLKRLSQRDYKLLLILSICAFSVYPMLVDILEELTGRTFNGLSTIGMYGSQYGYTIVNFVLMYVIGAYIRRYGIKASSSKLLIVLIVNTFILATWGRLDEMLGYNMLDFVHVERNAWEYCNPIVILQAIIIFVLFMRMDFVNSIVNNLAKASFCVYLIHGHFIGHLKITQVVSMQNPLITILHIATCCISIYLFGFITNWIYSWAIQLIDKPIDRTWNRHRKYEVNL